jgi:hypothetical protein
VTASQVVLALQTIRSRTLSPTTPNVVTVGTFSGGGAAERDPRVAQAQWNNSHLLEGDDGAIPIGMRAMTIAILDYLGGSKR